MYSFGLGVVPNYQYGVKWYALAAEQGHALAQYNLGRLYYLGKGVPLEPNLRPDVGKTGFIKWF